jgi:hypothetical protein
MAGRGVVSGGTSNGKSFACFLHNNNELKIIRYQIDFEKNT